MNKGHHEDFSREVLRQGPSNRSFGAVFSAFFLFLALSPFLKGRAIRPAWLGLSVAVFIICLVRPSLLGPANLVWSRLGLLLGKVVNPIVTGLLFYVVFTPAAVIIRWTGKDLLALSRDEEADSYWISRPASSGATEMTDQF